MSLEIQQSLHVCVTEILNAVSTRILVHQNSQETSCNIFKPY